MKQSVDCKKSFDKRAILFNKLDWVSDKLLLKEIISTIEKYEPNTLLDLGIGTGVVERELSPDIKITGVDSSPEMCEVCRKNLPEATIKVEDIQDLSFLGSNKFDVIFARATLGHIQISPLLKKLRKYLTKRGHIILCESISYSILDIQNQLYFHNLIHPGHKEFPTKYQFIKLFKQNGFSVNIAKVLYTRCGIRSLFRSVKNGKQRKKIIQFLRASSKSSLQENWKILLEKKEISYRRPWLLISAY